MLDGEIIKIIKEVGLPCCICDCRNGSCEHLRPRRLNEALPIVVPGILLCVVVPADGSGVTEKDA